VACINRHKAEYSCDGRKPETTAIKMPLSAMNIEILRRDMALIEKGIGFSNTLKRDNIQAERVNHSKSVSELRDQKKRKNLRQFLRKKRQLTFINAPANMRRVELNRTRLQTGGKTPFV
jgi:hypothetical protein